LLWFDDEPNHRLTAVDPCPATDGTPDTACVLFVGHGGPHRFAAPTTPMGFGAHYRPDPTISSNGSRHSGTVATVSEEAPADSAVAETTSRHHREPELPQTRPSPPRAGPATDHARTPTVDEALLAVADALSELARALRHRAD
jgi:hypothetical protein